MFCRNAPAPSLIFSPYRGKMLSLHETKAAHAMKQYGLGFISDRDIYKHVRETVLQYRRSISLNDFNKNLIDPVKLTFDAKIYGQNLRQTIESECIRQIDKTNNNRIGYFHQYLFKYAGNGWEVPANGEHGGFDVVNDNLHVYVEMKNKHNTMNAASAQKTYMKMQQKLLEDDLAECILVEVIAKKSQNIKWETTLDGKKFSHDKIRRVSIDKFYEFVFSDRLAFFKLCKAIPDILDDVISDDKSIKLTNTVYEELGGRGDLMKDLYLLAFSTYEGFDKF